MVWRWEDAPEEFRALSKMGGGEESVVFVPEELLTRPPREYASDTSGLWFLNWFPKRGKDGVRDAGDAWGCYALYDLPGRGRVAITAESKRYV